VISLLLAFVSLHGSFRDVKRTAYFNDESRWINRADFLKEALHPFSVFWEDRYIVRAQPPMGSYIIGLGLLVQGTRHAHGRLHGDDFLGAHRGRHGVSTGTRADIEHGIATPNPFQKEVERGVWSADAA